MIIRNNTHEPLAVRVKGLGLPEEEDEELLELEPGEEEDVEGRFLEELLIEPSPVPHFVSQVEINEN